MRQSQVLKSVIKTTVENDQRSQSDRRTYLTAGYASKVWEKEPPVSMDGTSSLWFVLGSNNLVPSDNPRRMVTVETSLVWIKHM